MNSKESKEQRSTFQEGVATFLSFEPWQSRGFKKDNQVIEHNFYQSKILIPVANISPIFGNCQLAYSSFYNKQNCIVLSHVH